ncbi:hypothetical protein ACWGLF_39680 [Streptomyces puniciscabiei]
MRGLLFSQMRPPPGRQQDFDDWYASEHIPARIALPGFEAAHRYAGRAPEDRHLACYFLRDMAELDSPAYRRLKSEPGERTARMLATVSGFTRYIADEISDTGQVGVRPGLLYVVAFAVPDDTAAEFEDWYEGEHVPLLMAADAWLRVRRYRVRPGGDGPAWTHLALHDLAGEDALDAPERAKARDTSRRAALAAQSWFGTGERWLYTPISRVVNPDPAPSDVRS